MNNGEKKESGRHKSSSPKKVFLDSHLADVFVQSRMEKNSSRNHISQRVLEALTRKAANMAEAADLQVENTRWYLVLKLRTYLLIVSAYLVMSERFRWKRAMPMSSIKQSPGSRLLKVTDFFCSPKTMKLTVHPLVADWRAEYFEALKQGREWKARWISARYYCAFGKALALDKVLGMLKAVSSAFSGG